MPIVRCRMTDCVNWNDGYCSAVRINVDDEGVCLTYSTLDDSAEETEEIEWEAEVDVEEEEEALNLDEEEESDDDGIVRGRRRWDEW